MLPMGEQKQEQNQHVDLPIKTRQRQRPRLLLLVVAILVLVLVLSLAQIIGTNLALTTLARMDPDTQPVNDKDLDSSIAPAASFKYNDHDNSSSSAFEAQQFLGSNSSKNSSHDDANNNQTSSSLSFTFPTVQERIRYYMASWYYSDDKNKHKNKNPEALFKNATSNNMLCHERNMYHTGCMVFDRPYFYDRQGLQEAYAAQPHKKILRDPLTLVFPRLEDPDLDVVLIHFGDTKHLYEWPVLVKTRPIPKKHNANDNENNKRERYDNAKTNQALRLPILVPLAVLRHFGPVQDLLPKKRRKSADTPWHKKNDTLVWRGASTGHGAKRRSHILQQFLFPKAQNISNSNSNGISTTMHSNLTHFDIEIDIGLSKLIQREEDDPTKRILLKSPMSRRQFLKYKYLLSLEGNDVASGLKWMLYSNSVVFMPLPTVASWAMEDRLVPYYHYIPLKSDLSDLPSKLQWARKHDAECHQISQQATQYMQDLWTSPQAERDTDLILTELIGRYQALYGHELQECANQEYSPSNHASNTTLRTG